MRLFKRLFTWFRHIPVETQEAIDSIRVLAVSVPGREHSPVVKWFLDPAFRENSIPAALIAVAANNEGQEVAALVPDDVAPIVMAKTVAELAKTLGVKVTPRCDGHCLTVTAELTFECVQRRTLHLMARPEFDKLSHLGLRYDNNPTVVVGLRCEASEYEQAMMEKQLKDAIAAKCVVRFTTGEPSALDFPTA